MDMIAYAAAKKYVDDTIKGAGSLKGEKGDPGPQGPQGPAGPAGSDANVTKENITAALNYTPVDPETIYTKEEIDKKIEENGGTAQIQADYLQNDSTKSDYIKNKPFYDTREIVHFDSTVTPNPVSYPIQEFNMTGYKIFDITPSKEDFLNMKITMTVGVISQIFTFTEKKIMVEWDNGFYIFSDQDAPLVLCQKAGIYTGTVNGVTFTCEVPEAGIYIIAEGAMPVGVTFEIVVGGELKTLDKKYFPEDMAYGYESKLFEDIIWDGNTEGLTPVSFNFSPEEGIVVNQSLYKVSDKVLSKDDYTRSMFELLYPEGTEKLIIEDGYNESSDLGTNGSFVIGKGYAVNVVVDNDTIDLTDLIGIEKTITFPEKGIWFVVASQDGTVIMQTSKLLARTNITKIDSKYLPIGETNGIAGLDDHGKIPQNQINTVFGVQQYNYNPITSGAVYIALGNRSQLNFDDAPTAYSNDLVTSGAVYQAIKNGSVSVTNTDNGKFMRVVDGAWAAVAVPNAEDGEF